jgi:DNA (cytosine-5)-methyltransferase 1
MAKKKPIKALRAIDLYSGVGGWALGLRLAGIEVVASYEHWGKANETNFKNNRHQAQTIDIRKLDLSDLPDQIDIVVGSPPCTQFSFSNRGGSGDIDDGLQDIIKFLTIVDHLKPKVWAMENVPRVAKIIVSELKKGGRLEKFSHLSIEPHIVNMEEFGLPQRRRRCIAGNFDFDLLTSYSKKTSKTTLGQIVRALATDGVVVDPLYNLEIPNANLRDHVIEASLNDEEVRINKASKMTHPVYNSMAFPDPLARSVRTITATCTRVSRESIVIETPDQTNSYRRLTVRERACLQGFPLVFQFYGTSYSQKLRMVGNAIPPLFTYYVAQAFKKISPDELSKVKEVVAEFNLPIPPAIDATPDRPGSSYPITRRFRFAIPSLRLKSGVRFELTNLFKSHHPEWEVAFYFGTSKSIQSLDLNKTLYDRILSKISISVRPILIEELLGLSNFIRAADIGHMQRVWCHRGPGETRPFMLLDKLDEIGANLIKLIIEYEIDAALIVEESISAEYGKNLSKLPGFAKLSRHSHLILSGFLIGSLANMELVHHIQAPSLRKKSRSAR